MLQMRHLTVLLPQHEKPRSHALADQSAFTSYGTSTAAALCCGCGMHHILSIFVWRSEKFILHQVSYVRSALRRNSL